MLFHFLTTLIVIKIPNSELSCSWDDAYYTWTHSRCSTNANLFPSILYDGFRDYLKARIWLARVSINLYFPFIFIPKGTHSLSWVVSFSLKLTEISSMRFFSRLGEMCSYWILQKILPFLLLLVLSFFCNLNRSLLIIFPIMVFGQWRKMFFSKICKAYSDHRLYIFINQQVYKYHVELLPTASFKCCPKSFHLFRTSLQLRESQLQPLCVVCYTFYQCLFYAK